MRDSFAALLVVLPQAAAFEDDICYSTLMGSKHSVEDKISKCKSDSQSQGHESILRSTFVDARGETERACKAMLIRWPIDVMNLTKKTLCFSFEAIPAI